MSPRRREPAPTRLSDDQLLEYGNFRYGLVSMTDADQTALAEAFPAVARRRWYTKALSAAYAAAYESGRLTAGNEVVGADDGHHALSELAQVGAGGAMDVAVAVLVADLITAEQYRQITSWWGKAGSAWLPEQPDPAAATQPVPQTAPQDVPRRLPPPAPALPAGPPERPEPAGWLPVDHLPPPELPGGPQSAPTTPGRPGAPQIDPDLLRRKLAADKKRRRNRRNLVVGRAVAAGWGLVIVAAAMLFLAADALGAHAFTPIGAWLGRGYGFLFFVILTMIAMSFAGWVFHLAANLKKGPY